MQPHQVQGRFLSLVTWTLEARLQLSLWRPMPEVTGKRLKPSQEQGQPIPGGHAQGSIEGRREWQQELGVPCSWFIFLITIVITTHRRLWETRRESQMLPFELSFIENGTFMGYIYIKCGK